MAKIILLTAVLCVCLKGVAQENFVWQHSGGVYKRVSISAWEEGWIATDYAQKKRSTQMHMTQYSVKHGQRLRLPKGEREQQFDSAGYMVYKSQKWKGKIHYTTRLTRKNTPTGFEVQSEYHKKKDRFWYATCNRFDTVNKTTLSYIRYRKDTAFYLRSVQKRNTSNRLLEYRTYIKHGTQPGPYNLYMYYTPEKLKTIQFFSGKGKLKRQANYTCEAGPDSIPKVKQSNLCIRTDKDPMGNTIEIEEQRIGKKMFIVMTTSSPDSLLLQIKTMTAKGKVISEVRCTYNDEKQLVSSAYFHKNSRKPALEKKYVYEGKALLLTEVYKEGTKFVEYEFAYKSL